MDILEILKILAALLSAGFGAFAVYQPETLARASQYSVDNARGRTELRVLGGGFFLGMGIGAILMGSVIPAEMVNEAYQVVGFSWLSAGLVRLLNLVLEAPKDILDRGFWFFLVSEIVPGAILLAPA